MSWNHKNNGILSQTRLPSLSSGHAFFVLIEEAIDEKKAEVSLKMAIF